MDWNIERINERWENGEEAKWCELNFDYLRVIRDEFENCAQYLNKQAKVIRDVGRKSRVEKVKEWLNDNELEDFIVEGKTFVESPVGTGS